MMSRSDSKLGYVRSKTRSLGQISKNLCVHSRGHSFDSKFTKLYQNLIIIISRSRSKLGHVGSETRSLGQILGKPCVPSKRHSFDPKFMKLCLVVNHHNI